MFFCLRRPTLTCNQVSKDNKLLDIARDFFNFATKFFEPINASATHVYHSALELCPTSSIVRKLYYYRDDRIIRSPKIAIGAPDSWNQVASISNKDVSYRFCTWSPCGQFIATRTRKVVEIRNHLTFELLTTLESISFLEGPLVYSPDGRSIACASNRHSLASIAAIIIWDIQTGGVAKEIRRGVKINSMAWSLDGRLLGATRVGDVGVYTYSVVSGKILSPKQQFSCIKSPLWASQESVRFIALDTQDAPLSIFEVGHTLTRICTLQLPSMTYFDISFSPTTYRLSHRCHGDLLVYQSSTPKPLLNKKGLFTCTCFSSDGGFFAASKADVICVWKYGSGRYILWKEFPSHGEAKSLGFSPDSLSIVGYSGKILQVWQLDDLPARPKQHCQEFTGLSRSSNHIVTAKKMEKIITVTDINTQVPSQLIDSGVGIKGLFITGRVLLVVGLEKTLAWLLTDEGLVDGVLGGRRANCDDSIWTIQLSHSGPKPKFWVKGQVAEIRCGKDRCVVFHTATGKILQPDQGSKCPSYSGNLLKQAFYGQDYFHFHNLLQSSATHRGTWQFTEDSLSEGWVKDLTGRQRLWVPIEWRTSWDKKNWCQSVMIYFGTLGGKLIIIKF